MTRPEAEITAQIMLDYFYMEERLSHYPYMIRSIQEGRKWDHQDIDIKVTTKDTKTTITIILFA